MLPNVKRTDVVYLLDLELEPKAAAILRRLTVASNDIVDRFDRSYDWLFYESQMMDFRRSALSSPLKTKNWYSACILIHDALPVGVLSVWQKASVTEDPLSAKNKAWGNVDREVIQPLQRNLPVAEIERFYPFVGIQVDTADLQRYCCENAEQLGRLFTGDYENEERDCLAGYVKDNLSRREYERLWIRWTEALAIYTANVDVAKYETTLFRAVQVFEYCIVLRRLFRTINEDVARVSSSRIPFALRWWEINNILNTFTDAQNRYVVSPAVQSVEAERLVSDGLKRFGVDRVAESTRQALAFLEQRFQWSKGIVVAAVAVITYTFDKLIGWHPLVCAAAKILRLPCPPTSHGN